MQPSYSPEQMLHATRLLAVFGLTLDATPEAAHQVAAGLKQEGYIKLSTTLHELGKGAAAALLAHADSEQERVQLIERCIEMAAGHRCALGVLAALVPYQMGWRPARADDALPYEGSAKSHAENGRLLLAQADGAVAMTIRLMAEVDRLSRQAREEQDRTYELVGMHQLAASQLAVQVNQANEMLDRLGVPRLALQRDEAEDVATRIRVFAGMRRQVSVVAADMTASSPR